MLVLFIHLIRMDGGHAADAGRTWSGEMVKIW